MLRVDPGDASADWQQALAASNGAPRLAPPDVEAPAGIAFTSGTTGLPKGIVHSQRNLLLPAVALVASRGYDETLRKGDCLALTILNMQVLTTLLTTTAGGCCILTDRRDGRGVAEWIAREAVTVWNGVPAQLYSMVHDPELDPGLLSSLREAWAGGSACPEEVIAGFQDRFGVPFRAVYGLTEAPTVVTIDPLDGRHVDGGCGLPLPHLDVPIRDDEGRVQPVGGGRRGGRRTGERGPWAGAYTTMLGEWGDDGRVEPHPAGGLRTGDLGVIDADGHLHIRDRKKLLIIRGGANVYPAEVERVMERVDGVRAAAVLGASRRPARPAGGRRHRGGGRLRGVDALLERCREELARYKVPDQVVVVDELPAQRDGQGATEPVGCRCSNAPERRSRAAGGVHPTSLGACPRFSKIVTPSGT